MNFSKMTSIVILSFSLLCSFGLSANKADKAKELEAMKKAGITLDTKLEAPSGDLIVAPMELQSTGLKPKVDLENAQTEQIQDTQLRPKASPYNEVKQAAFQLRDKPDPKVDGKTKYNHADHRILTRDCVDTDNGATDPYGDGCAAYNNYPSWCGNYDDDDFTSNEMCCICGGGDSGDDGEDDVLGCTDSDADNWNPDATVDDGSCTYPEPDPCWDTDNGATDPYGDGCAAYNNFPSWCGGYDDDDFVSNEMCCVCGGGTNEEPAEDVLGCTDDTADNWNPDATVDDGSCTYPEPEPCWDTDNGAVDSWGYSCEANNGVCYNGAYDDDDFFELEMCCACGGGTNEEPAEDVLGCTDETADNYDSDATVDDGSCTYPAGCEDTDNGAVDSWGYSCEANAGVCYNGAYDDDDFFELQMCCACGGGTDWEEVLGCTDETADNYDSDANTDDGSCTYPEPDPCWDTDNGAVDSWGDGCAAYNDYPSWCGGYDDDDFDSLTMCCICGGGTDEEPSEDVLGCTDEAADNYDSDATVDDGSCTYSECWDTDNGATDPYGDGCAAYNNYPSWCGNYDDDDFTSNEMCCVCGGGTDFEEVLGCTDDAADNWNPDATVDDGSCTYPPQECWDTDNGALDSYNDGCAAYYNFPSWCGGYDDDDFNSLEMCCACGGGTDEEPTGDPNEGLCFDSAGFNFDIDGDGYVDTESLCDYYILYQWYFGYSCEFVESYGYDCTDVDDCGGCEAEVDPCQAAGGAPNWISDGYCDSQNNQEACGWDGGDCCPSTCVDANYSCDSYGGTCDTCVDPAAEDANYGGSCTPPAICDDEAACNFDQEGQCVYAEAGYDCDGNLAEGYHLDCVGVATADSYLSWIGDGYCDDGSWGVDYTCCEFNLDNGDCGDALDCAGTAVDCGGDAIVDECGECGGAGIPDGACDCDGNVADCAGDCGGDAVVDECGTCGGDGTAGTNDFNADCQVNVLDVILLVGAVVNGDDVAGADLNGDGEINVIDVVLLVNDILSPRTANANNAIINTTDNSLSITADGYIGGVQMTLSHDNDFEINLTDNALVAEYKTSGTNTILVVVAPEDELLFTTNKSFEIVDMIVANSTDEIEVNTVTDFGLSTAYPNPFNPSTTVSLTVPSADYVSVKVYNLMGQVVGVLADGMMEANIYSFTWNASDMSSGVYLIKAESSSSVDIQKVLLVK